VAGGTVLVREAGGRVTDFSGGADFLGKQEILAGNAVVFEEALAIVKGAFGD